MAHGDGIGRGALLWSDLRAPCLRNFGIRSDMGCGSGSDLWVSRIPAHRLNAKTRTRFRGSRTWLNASSPGLERSASCMEATGVNSRLHGGTRRDAAGAKPHQPIFLHRHHPLNPPHDGACAPLPCPSSNAFRHAFRAEGIFLPLDCVSGVSGLGPTKPANGADTRLSRPRATSPPRTASARRSASGSVAA